MASALCLSQWDPLKYGTNVFQTKTNTDPKTKPVQRNVSVKSECPIFKNYISMICLQHEDSGLSPDRSEKTKGKPAVFVSGLSEAQVHHGSHSPNTTPGTTSTTNKMEPHFHQNLFSRVFNPGTRSLPDSDVAPGQNQD